MLSKIAPMLIATMLLLATAQAENSPNPQLSVQRMNLMPLAFTHNEGQWNDAAVFRAYQRGASIWFTQDKVYYQFTRKFPGSRLNPVERASIGPLPDSHINTVDYEGLSCNSPSPSNSDEDSVATLSLSASFIGANPNPRVIGEDPLEYKCNYFIGNDPTKWHTDVPNYQAVVYKEIYPGIDLKYYGNGDGKLEYDFIIQPGADPCQIAVHYDGAKNVCVDEEGDLVVETEWGKVTERQPIIYQLNDNKKSAINGKYALLDENTFGFRFDDDYQPALALVVDPTLSYSTYLGGGTYDAAASIAVDGGGNAYVAGTTYSLDFPTLNPVQGTKPGFYDVLITKLNSTGSGLVYSTWLGGIDDDEGRGIAVDGGGSAYVTGYTRSNDFPTQNAFQTTHASKDAFVTKLSSAGNLLIYSTFLGGINDDYGNGIALDGTGNAYITGYTFSFNFPILNAFQPTYVDIQDAFVTELSSAGNTLIYSTFLGSNDVGNAIAVDGSNNAYVTGATSGGLPTQNPYQGTFQGIGDAFVTKINNAGTGLIFSTYLGGSSGEIGKGIAIDAGGNVYVTGQTDSPDFPTLNPIQATIHGTRDGSVTKFNSAGNTLSYSTYLGGASQDVGNGIAVDNGGNAYIVGSTFSTNFPLQNPIQATYGGGALAGDAFVTKFNTAGTSLKYSTYIGGSLDDPGFGIAVDGSGGAYVTGYTSSNNFPTQNPYQAHSNSFGSGNANVFVSKLQQYVCGDANGDKIVNISDAVYLIAYIFVGGPAPNPLLSGDSNCDLNVNISDAVYVIAYIFAGGPAPCASCK